MKFGNCIDCGSQFRVTGGGHARCNPCSRARTEVQLFVGAMVKKAVRSGRLMRMACEVCGKTAEAHHDDYGRPLNVRWLCRSHHRKFHNDQNKLLANGA